MAMQGTRQALLSSLFYPDHAARRENVKPPWENTFKWIFEDYRRNSVEWSSFPEWLRTRSSTYWISGKAGSGKSTLMTHILHDDRLKENLGIWSPDHEVHVLSFFFWRPGSILQKSVVGMLRSILYQLLEEIPRVFNALEEEHGPTSRPIPSWTERALAKLQIAAIGALPDHVFCLFIDGLDEFEGDTDELLDLVLNLQNVENVKCCLSSRPEIQLVARLSTCEQLRLQDLNLSDIRQFVKERLVVYGKGHRISGFISEITDYIASKADGVFLWAALVTRSVIQGLQAGDDEDMVRKRLETTPPAMEALFSQMLSGVDDVHKDSVFFYVEVMKSGALGGGPDTKTASVALITASSIERT